MNFLHLLSTITLYLQILCSKNRTQYRTRALEFSDYHSSVSVSFLNEKRSCSRNGDSSPNYPGSHAVPLPFVPSFRYDDVELLLRYPLHIGDCVSTPIAIIHWGNFCTLAQSLAAGNHWVGSATYYRRLLRSARLLSTPILLM